MQTGSVVDLQAERDRRDRRAREEAAAWDAFARALTIAQADPRLKNMAAAVRAWEAWLALAIPDEAERRSVLP